MKKVLILAVIMLFAATSAFAATSIVNSKHNLTRTSQAIYNTEATGQICVYCHTPHGANTGFPGAPLWNKATPSGSYTLYGTTVANHTPIAGGPTGSSLACLSCHDGVQAINSIVNQAGAGGYTAAGTNIAWTAPSTTAGTAVTMLSAGNAAANLGQDLSNDHPISIQYQAGSASLKAKNTALTSWIGATMIQDVLRTSGANTDLVECASCHAVHDDSNGMFLRASNSGSALCLGCHDK